MLRRVGLPLALALVLFGASFGAAPLHAQETPPAPEDEMGATQNRPLEDTVRQRLAAVVKDQVGLTDDQMRQLREVNKRYAKQRRELVQQERDIRLSLRDEIKRGSAADQSHVNSMIEQLGTLEHQRLNVVQQEQRDLAGFMTPVQRAKYLAIQERVRKAVQQIRQRQLERGVRPPPARPKPRSR